METTASIRALIKKHAKRGDEREKPYKPHEINIKEIPAIVRCGVLLATAKTADGQELMLCINDAAKFFEVIELWNGCFYLDLEFWFVPNSERAAFACEFIKLYGSAEDVQKNPLRFKGLGWGATYWVAIANDNAQGELFSAVLPEPLPLNVGDNEVFTVFRRALAQGKFRSLTFFKLKKTQGDQFRQVFPWWIQRHLLTKFREQKNDNTSATAG